MVIAKGSLAGEKDMRKSIPFGSGVGDNCINVAWKFQLQAVNGAMYTEGTPQICLALVNFQYPNVGHCLKCGSCFIRKIGL